ncbi:MAG: hypothetical protein K2J04_02925 [Lachnospiraceae bacterium]|nr:hypothetical protein [Lachnospiraceae bacterium]
MLLEEFDVDKYERSLKNEGIEIGIQQGLQQGMEQGIKYGQQIERERISKLTCILLEQDRIADIKRSSEDFEYQQQLLKEFDILS